VDETEMDFEFASDISITGNNKMFISRFLELGRKQNMKTYATASIFPCFFYFFEARERG